MQPISHEYLSSFNRELHYEGGVWRHIVVLETLLPLTEAEAGFDRAKLGAMISAIDQQLRDLQLGYHRLIIRPAK